MKARVIQIYKEKYCRGNEGEKCEKRSLKKKMRSFVGFNDDRLMNLCRRKPKYENGFLRMRKTVKKEQCLNENGSEFRGILEEVVYQILFFFYFSQIVKYGGSQIDIEVGGCW